MKNFDVIIIGAGGIGSAAAYYLARQNQRVLLLEQFELNHQKGSSYGYSRVIRYAYDHRVYIDLMREAYPLWFELEAKAEEDLFLQTGELDFGLAETESLQTLISSMETAAIPFQLLSVQEVHRRFPQFRLAPGMIGVYQAETGLLRASKCVLSHLKLAVAKGAVIEENTAVLEINPKVQGVEVKTTAGIFYGKNVIFATGSWTKELLAQLNLALPLDIMPCQIGYYQPG